MNLDSLGGILTGFFSGKQRILGGSLALALMGFVWQGEGEQAAIYRDEPARDAGAQAEPARKSSQNQAVSIRESDSSAMEQVGAFAKSHPSWGNAAMRFGLSFFVAMMIASLLKAFVKTMVVVLLVVGGALVFMEHRGMIEPFWDQQMGFLISAKDWTINQSDSVVGFLKGYLPSTGAASAGFFMGIRR